MRTLFYLAGFALLAGCTGGTAQTPVAATAASAQSLNGRTAPSRPATNRLTPFVNVAGIDALHGNHTFVTDSLDGTVTVWGENGELNAVLFDGLQADPQGLTVDADQKLYVANGGLSNVIVYRKPYTSISLTLNDAGELSTDIAVDKHGLVGVTNYLTSNEAPGSVSFYAKNATSPCKTIQDPNWTYFFNDAFDASGNLFHRRSNV